MLHFAHIRTTMKENQKTTKYPSGNKKTETYSDSNDVTNIENNLKSFVK